MQLRDISLSRKLYASFTVLILLLVALASFAYWQISKIQHVHIPARTAVREMDDALFSMEIYERNLIIEANSPNNVAFYLKRQSKNYTAWEENYNKLDLNFERLSKLYAGTTVASQLSTARPHFTDYRDNFLKVISKYQQRGFKDFGREGTMRQRAHDLEVAVTKLEDQLLLLQMRRYEKDFFLRKEVASVDNFNNIAERLKGRILAPDQRIILEEYTGLFAEIVKLNIEIGLTPEEGLQGKMRSDLARSLPAIQSAEQQVLSSTANSIDAINRTLLIVTAAFIVIAVTLAVAISRFITGRLQMLLAATKNITAGKLNYHLPLDSKDELGALAQSFNAMAEKLSLSQKAVNDRAKALARSVSKFELASKAVNEAVYDWDMTLDRLEWGEGLIRVFGYEKENLKTPITWWTDRIHPDDIEAINKSLEEHLSRANPAWAASYRFKKANGQYAYAEDRGFIEYHQGKPIRMVGSLVDVTKQQQLDRAKDEFISIVSHQLRTPLTAIRLFVEMLAKQQVGKLNAQQQDYIEKVAISTDRMIRLVGDILNVSRIELGRVKINPTPTDVSKLIQTHIDEIAPVAAAKKVTITYDAPAKLPLLPVDQVIFGQVVHNLLTNALRYSRTDKPHVVVSYGKDKHGGYLLSVKDNGIGIPKAAQPRMFDRFFRAENAIKVEGEGTGLGLYLIKIIIDTAGGKVWFDSIENEGTTFYVRLNANGMKAKDGDKSLN